MPDRLERSEVRTLVAWVVAGIVGMAVAIALFPVAFREAAIDFRIDGADAERTARAFFHDRGLSTDGWIGISTLDVDREAQVYLERVLGPERANALMAADVPVSAFRVRLFRDSQQEELSARVDPAGRVIGMRHVVPEARGGPRLEREDARRVADAFFRSVEPRADRYAFLADETSSTERPSRRDWTFTWERADLRAGDAPYRLTVTVLGDQVGALEQGLRVPDAWKREFSRMRSENFLYQFGAQLLYALLLVSAIVLLVRHVRRGALRWQPVVALIVGFGAFLAVTQLNGLAGALASYDTRESWLGVVARQALLLVAGGLFVGVLVGAQSAAGEPLYRAAWPDRLRLWSAWRLRAIRSKEAFRAAVIGLSLAGAHLGAVVVFYVVGLKIGVWAPQEIRYDDALSTPLPWLVPIGTALYASASEESAFRLVAIPLLLRLTRSKLVAIVVPAFAWGFLHSTYPVEPGYVRGIEVGLIGIVAGLVFLRWGLLPVLIWHFTIDAALIGVVLARWGAAFQISAAIVALAILAPLLVMTALYFRRRSFVTAPDLLNGAEPLPAPAAAAPATLTARYAPATRRAITALLVAGLGGAVVYVAIRPPAVGSFVKASITADDALALADDALRARGVDPHPFQRVATFGGYPVEGRIIPSETRRPDDALPSGPSFDPLVNEYLRREVGVEGANALYAVDVPSAFWRVRYFRELDRREQVVLLRPDGAPFAVWRRIEEAAPGASLSETEAVAVVQRYLREQQRVDVSRWRVVETSLLKRPARTDANVILERNDTIGEAHVRAELRVADGDVIAYRAFVKLPEEWERRERQQDLAAIVTAVARALIVAAIVVTIGVLFFRQLRRARIPWRPLGVVAAAGVATFPVAAVNGMRDFVAGYTTEVPFTTYFGMLALSDVAATVILFGLLFVTCGAAWMFASRAFGEERLVPARTPEYWRDALFLGLGAAATMLGLGRLDDMADAVLPSARAATAASLPTGVDLLLPAGQPLAAVTTIPLFALALIAIGAGVVAWYVRPRLIPLLVILLAFAIGWQGGPLAASLKSTGVAAIWLTVGFVLVTRALRWNAAAYLIAIVTPPLLGTVLGLAAQPNAWYVANAGLAAAALVSCYAVPLVLWRRGAPVAVVPSVTAEAAPRS